MPSTPTVKSLHADVEKLRGDVKKLRAMLAAAVAKVDAYLAQHSSPVPAPSDPPVTSPPEPAPVPPTPQPPAGVPGVELVAKVKADLEQQGISLAGACGAFRILNGVALRLWPRYGLLRKHGGNRAIPQGDGRCVTDADSTDPGYATDYLIDTATGFGYDILGDGGGANNPQWLGPEDALDMVARNRVNVAPPVPR